MTEPHVVTALRAKRAEISGHVADLERKLARHRANLANIDATIRLFAPTLDPDTIPPKRTYRRTRYFAKGELSRRVLDILRNANKKPLATADIVCSIMTGKGFPLDEGALSSAVTDMALTVLRRLCKRGTVTKSGISRNVQWVLAASFLQEDAHHMPLIGMAVAWFRKEDWPRWLTIDPNFQPDYDHWLKRTETAIAELQKSGTLTEKVVIDPDEFLEWSRCNRGKVDSQSRATYTLAEKTRCRTLKPFVSSLPHSFRPERDAASSP